MCAGRLAARFGPIRRRSQSVPMIKEGVGSLMGRRPPPDATAFSFIRRFVPDCDEHLALRKHDPVRYVSQRHRSQRAYAALAFWRSRHDSTRA